MTRRGGAPQLAAESSALSESLFQLRFDGRGVLDVFVFCTIVRRSVDSIENFSVYVVSGSLLELLDAEGVRGRLRGFGMGKKVPDKLTVKNFEVP